MHFKTKLPDWKSSTPLVGSVRDKLQELTVQGQSRIKELKSGGAWMKTTAVFLFALLFTLPAETKTKQLSWALQTYNGKNGTYSDHNVGQVPFSFAIPSGT